MTRAEINEIQNRKTTEKNQWSEKLVLQNNFNKIGKTLPRLIKNKRKKTTPIFWPPDMKN